MLYFWQSHAEATQGEYMNFLGESLNFYIIFGGLWLLLFSFTGLILWANKSDQKKKQEN